MSRTNIVVRISGRYDELKRAIKKAKALVSGFARTARKQSRGPGGRSLYQLPRGQAWFPQPSKVSSAFKKVQGTYKKASSLFTQAFQNIKKQEEPIKKLGTALKGTGRRLSWFGFRLTMMGRMFARALMKPVSKALALFKGWDTAVGDLGLSLGMLAATGQLTGDRQDSLINAMNQLITTGPKVQAIMGRLSAVFINMAGPIIDELYPSILDLIDIFEDLWETNKDKVMATLKKLIEDVIPKVITAIEDMGPAFTSFIDGFADGAAAITALMENPKVGAFLTWISYVIGYLLPFAPLLTLVGIALFALSVPLQAAGAALSVLWGAFVLLGATLTGPMILAVAAFALAWSQDWLWIRDITKTIINEILGWITHFIESVQWAINVVNALMGRPPVDTDPDAGTLLWEAAQTGKGIGKKPTTGIGALDEYLAMMATMPAINFDISQQMEDMRAEFDEIIAGMDNIPDIVVPQSVHIDLDVEVGSITGDADIDKLTDEISRKLVNRIAGGNIARR